MGIFRGLKKICIAYGAYKIIEAGYSIGSTGYIYCIKPDEGTKGKIKDGYAIVTGGTQGIGKEYARSLARRGFNLVLISRDENNLRTVQEEISSEFKVDVRTIGFDFREDRPEEYEERLFKPLRDLELSVLVNNVGMMSCVQRFEKQSLEDINNMLVVNDLSAVYLTNFYLRKLAASRSKARGKNLIVNLGSLTGCSPFPFKSAYAASKRFVHEFSQALGNETGANTQTQVLTPGMVDTGKSGHELGGNKCGRSFLHWQRVPAGEIAENSLKNVENSWLCGSLKHELTVEFFKRLGTPANECLRLWNFYLMQTH